jgi:hypothetical protein
MEARVKLQPYQLAMLFLLGAIGCANQPPIPIPSATVVSPATSAIPNLQPTLAAPTSVPLTTPSKSSTPLGQPTPQAILTQNSSPRVLSFTVTPTSTVGLNVPVSLSWEANGERAEICRLGSAGPLDCQPVPLVGKITIATDQSSPLINSLALRVYIGQSSIWSLIDVRECLDPSKWFFDNAPKCPDGAAKNSHAAAQSFERGFMIWVESWDTFYVFFSGNNQTFERQSAPYNFKPGASAANRIGEKAPPGLFEPISGFGQIWRGEMIGIEAARSRLGWATAPEFSFDTTYQCAVSGSSRLWSCYLRGPTGKILWLRPDSTAGVNLLWQEL